MSLTGELDLATAPDLVLALDPVPLVSGRVMVVDLTGLAFCDCAGIGTLIDQQKRLLAAGGALMIVNPPRQFQRLIDITGVDGLDVRLAG